MAVSGNATMSRGARRWPRRLLKHPLSRPRSTAAKSVHFCAALADFVDGEQTVRDRMSWRRFHFQFEPGGSENLPPGP